MLLDALYKEDELLRCDMRETDKILSIMPDELVKADTLRGLTN
jgi:hypothetical protein